MAGSAEFVRLAGAVMRALPETAFEALLDAVLVVDAKHEHLPLVLANAAARRCFTGSDWTSLTHSSVYALLGPHVDTALEAALDAAFAARDANRVAPTRLLHWRLLRGETAIATELKVLHPTAGHRMVMLTFCPPATGSPPLSAIEHRPLDLKRDTRLTVAYGCGTADTSVGATSTAGGTAAGTSIYSGLTLIPPSARPHDPVEQPVNGNPWHQNQVAAAIPGTALHWLDVNRQPLESTPGPAAVSMKVANGRWRKQVPSDGERRLRALTEHATDIIAVAGRDGELQYISGGIRNALGYSVEERVSNSLFDLIHPEAVANLRQQYALLVAGTIPPFTLQFRIRHKNGSYRWLESNYVPALDNPLINGVVINSRDITARRQAEIHLAQREEIFRLAADAVQGVIFEWDLERGTVKHSRGLNEVLGFDPEDLVLAGAWSARVHPEDGAAYAKITAEGLRCGSGWTANYRIRDVHGRYRFMLERSLVQRAVDGRSLRVIGCCVDVSEIKRLNDLLAQAQRAARMGGWEYGYTTRELIWTDEMFRIYETQPKEFEVSLEAMLARFTAESRRQYLEACTAAERSSGRFDLELEIVTLKDRRLWVRLIGQAEMLDGHPRRAFGSMQNIQAQKLAQIALENSTGWLKLSMNLAQIHAWRWDRATDSLEFAALDGRMLHLPRVFPGLKQLLARMHPRDRLVARRAIDKAFATRTDVQEEFRLKSNDGKYRSYAAVARPLFDAAHRPSGLVGVTQDITARRESEARVRRSEALLRTTTANSADTLILVDTDLTVRFINRGELGMTIEEIIGRSIEVLLPDASRETIVATLRRVLATGEPSTYESELRRLGAQTLYLETRAVLVSEHGAATGISITVRNVTERKRLEREVLEVSSRERQTIGRDLHDGLGQELTGVALMLRGLATRIQRQCPESLGQVNEIVALVNQSIETARSLARGLLPVNTDSGGLTSALRSLAARNRDLYGFAVNFRTEITSDLPLSETQASHLYRIAQEALTNTARHARATSVDVFLRVSKGHFELQVTDDGVGTPESGLAGSGMGLKIMKYRASMIGARFEIGPHPARGTAVRVTGEQPPAMSSLQSTETV